MANADVQINLEWCWSNQNRRARRTTTGKVKKTGFFSEDIKIIEMLRAKKVSIKLAFYYNHYQYFFSKSQINAHDNFQGDTNLKDGYTVN